MADIRGVVFANLRRDGGVGTEESGSHLSHQLLARIAFVSPIACGLGHGSNGSQCLVQWVSSCGKCGGMALRIGEGFKRRHLDMVRSPHSMRRSMSCRRTRELRPFSLCPRMFEPAGVGVSPSGPRPFVFVRPSGKTHCRSRRIMCKCLPKATRPPHQ